MSIKNVLLGPSSFAEVDKSPLKKLENSGFRVIDNPFKRKLSRHELKTLLNSEVCGIIAGLEPLDSEVLKGTSVKVISRVGSGVSNVDLDYCRLANIKVCSTPNGPTEAVAELTLGALLSLMRLVPQMSSMLHQGIWEKKIGFELKGKTVLIVGFGRIGRRVAELMKPFGVDFLIVDPRATKESVSDYGRLLTLDEALPLADIITFHNNGESCLLDDSKMDTLKQGVFVLNVSRGGVVSEDALVKGLKSGRIRGAWLDTFIKEPYKGELTSFPQVILTPHVGSYTAECRVSMENEAVDNFLNAIKEYI